MRGAVGGRRLLGGLVAHENAMRLAVVGVNVGHLVAAVSLTVVSHKRGQPPRRASDAHVFLNAQSKRETKFALTVSGMVDCEAASIERYDNFTWVGKQVTVEGQVVLQPPLVNPFGGRRWLEEYESPPWTKKGQKASRASSCLPSTTQPLRVAPSSGRRSGRSGRSWRPRLGPPSRPQRHTTSGAP